MIRDLNTSLIYAVDMDRVNALLFGYQDNDIETVFARRRHFVSLNLIKSVSEAGKGKALVFALSDFFQLVYALELLKLGISPQKIALFYQTYQDSVHQASQIAWSLTETSRHATDIDIPPESDLVWLISSPRTGEGFSRFEGLSMRTCLRTNLDASDLTCATSTVMAMRPVWLGVMAARLIHRLDIPVLNSVDTAVDMRKRQLVSRLFLDVRKETSKVA